LTRKPYYVIIGAFSKQPKGEKKMMDSSFKNHEELLDAVIGKDMQNLWLDIYEQETGLEPVPEDGGHTDDFEEWLVLSVMQGWLAGFRSLDAIAAYFNIRRENRPDRSRDRTNDLAFKFAMYGINGAGADSTPEQKKFGAECVEVALRLMEIEKLDCISSPEGNFSICETRLLREWRRLSREAAKLRRSR